MASPQPEGEGRVACSSAWLKITAADEPLSRLHDCKGYQRAKKKVSRPNTPADHNTQSGGNLPVNNPSTAVGRLSGVGGDTRRHSQDDVRVQVAPKRRQQQQQRRGSGPSVGRSPWSACVCVCVYEWGYKCACLHLNGLLLRVRFRDRFNNVNFGR